MLRIRPSVNLGLLLAVACAAPEPVADRPAAASGPRTTSRRIGPATLDVRLPPPPRSRPPALPPAGWAGEESPSRALLGTLADALPDGTRGAALAAAIEALPPERRALGIQGLGPEDLFGADGEGGLCESPVLVAPAGGEELALAIDPLVWLTPPVRDLVDWPPACRDALVASGGDLAAADACTAEDEETFFPAGSTCRACLEVDGDVDRCEAEAACPSSATRRILGPDASGTGWVSVLTTSALACAPDLEIPGLLLVDDLAEGEPLPRVFEPGRYTALCLELWDAAEDAPGLFCAPAGPNGHALADFVVARVHGGPLDHRVAMAAEVATIGGRTWAMQLVYEGTLGAVSLPLEQGGWGLDPWATRPGSGSYARSLLAGWTLKLTTTRDGVPVQPVDHNRCVDWGPPDADGAATCREMGPWTFTWLDDGMVVWYDPAAGDIYVYPLLTLISTGLPDPSLPGGVVMHVRGSTTVSALEGCAWPDPFVPDRVRLYDSAPATADAPYASFDGETFRFDRDPGIVLALASNQRRGFCPGG